MYILALFLQLISLTSFLSNFMASSFLLSLPLYFPIHSRFSLSSSNRIFSLLIFLSLLLFVFLIFQTAVVFITSSSIFSFLHRLFPSHSNPQLSPPPFTRSFLRPLIFVDSADLFTPVLLYFPLPLSPSFPDSLNTPSFPLPSINPSFPPLRFTFSFPLPPINPYFPLLSPTPSFLSPPLPYLA